MKFFHLSYCALVFVSVPSYAYEEPNVGTSQQPITIDGGTAKLPADACRQGFVWREARAIDHVCVTPATRETVHEQNRTRKSRWVNGPYGPHTCIPGYVWREAFTGDDVCVTPQFRERTMSDNEAAAQRRAR